jgi:hypothetical protein
VLYYTCTNHYARVLFRPCGGMHRAINRQLQSGAVLEARRCFLLALSASLWFLLDLVLYYPSTLLEVGEVPTEGLKGFGRTIAATLCFA